MEDLKKIVKKTDSKTEKYWVLFFKILGVLMFLISVYLPLRGMVDLELGEIKMTHTRWAFMLVGFFLVWGASSFGILTNNIGVAIGNALNKFTK